MFVVHLEHNEATRTQLARLLNMHGGRMGGFEYLATEVAADARRKILADSVKALVLDLGLNPAWDNKHLYHVLRHLALGEALTEGERASDCIAHGITLLAHRHHVPAAVLTNYADYTGGDPPLTEAKIREAFQVQAIFHKDGDGLNQCAAWVRGVLEIE
jgi:hypothetical protein